MSQATDTSYRDVWLAALVAVVVATSLTILILKAWDQWLGFLVLGYAVLLFGGYMWLPWKGRVGYPVAIGILFGAVIPLGVRMWMAVR